MTEKNHFPWYKDGLKFECTQCGKCCTGNGGFIWVDDDDIARMSKELNITEKVFKMKYTRVRHKRLALVEKKVEGLQTACIFLEGKTCRLYHSRPKQCRTYPWWKENLSSEESWKMAAEECEGIREDAPLVSFEEIQKNLMSE